MIRPPPRSTRTDTLFPYTTLFRSSDLPYFSADAPNWCVSLIQRQPRGQNRNQAGRSCNDLEIGAEAFQVIQMKIDTGGYSDGQRDSPQSNIRSSPHDCAAKNHTIGRAADRRVGKEWVSMCRSRVSPYL